MFHYIAHYANNGLSIIWKTHLVEDVQTDWEHHVLDDYPEHGVRTSLYITLASQCLGCL